MESTHRRYLVTFSAVVIGIGWAAWDFLSVAPTLPPTVARQTPPEVNRALFDACVTFYGCVYGVGKAGYRLLGRRDEAEELRRWSRWHMRLLNAVGGAWLCWSAWQSFRNLDVIRPAAVVGAALLVFSLVSISMAAVRAARGGLADT